MSRLYHVNDNYFDVLDTPNKAYILGLLYSDGCNYVKSNYMFIELQDRDKAILEKIAKEMEITYPLIENKLHDKNPNWKNTYRLNWHSEHMSKRLCELGVVPKKSLIIQFPQWMPDELMPHFMRGLMDGDGLIWAKGGRYFITIASSKEFCEDLQAYVYNHFGDEYSSSINLTHNKEASNCRIWRLGQKQHVKTFLDWIYKDADLYLNRKFLTYQYIVESCVNNPRCKPRGHYKKRAV